MKWNAYRQHPEAGFRLLGQVDAPNGETAIQEAKRAFPMCCAPAVELASPTPGAWAFALRKADPFNA